VRTRPIATLDCKRRSGEKAVTFQSHIGIVYYVGANLPATAPTFLKHLAADERFLCCPRADGALIFQGTLSKALNIPFAGLELVVVQPNSSGKAIADTC
jgi:hypothetical protein